MNMPQKSTIIEACVVWVVNKSQELAYGERATRQFFDALDRKLMEKLTRCSGDAAWVKACVLM